MPLTAENKGVRLTVQIHDHNGQKEVVHDSNEMFTYFVAVGDRNLRFISVYTYPNSNQVVLNLYRPKEDN